MAQTPHAHRRHRLRVATVRGGVARGRGRGAGDCRGRGEPQPGGRLGCFARWRASSAWRTSSAISPFTLDSSSRCFWSLASSSTLADSISCFCTSAAPRACSASCLAHGELFLRTLELVHELVVALRGHRGVLLARRELVGVRARRARRRRLPNRIACRPTPRARRRGAQLGGLRLCGGDRGVGGANGRVRRVELDLRVVDLLVERAELAPVLRDLRFELRGLRPLVVDRCAPDRARGQRRAPRATSDHQRRGGRVGAAESRASAASETMKPYVKRRAAPARTLATCDRASVTLAHDTRCVFAGRASQSGQPFRGGGSPGRATSG